MTKMEVLGVDIGGTNIKAGNIRNGVLIKKSVVAVNTEDTFEKTVTDLLNCINNVFNKNVKAIGIGVPAVVDPIMGIAYDVQNIPSWKEITLKTIVQKQFKVPVFINNDANCFAFGEKIFGNGIKHKNFVGLSIGTGLGMGIIINNQLYNGVLCGAGEIGMLPYKDSILEHYTGSFFFSKKYSLSAKEVSEKAKANDLEALDAFEEFGIHLGEALKIILYMFSPEAIILGGSISKSFSFFEKSMLSSLKSFAYQKQIENLIIKTSNQPHLAILGAAALCMQD